MDLIPTPNDPSVFTPQAQSEADKTLLVKFFIQPMEDRAASADAGRPVFRDVEFIDIKIPGSHAGACRPATLKDKNRFPEHYKAFKDRQEMPEEGTPLAQWPPMSRSMVEQLAFFNVKTVEQLANISDASTQNIRGLMRFKNLAKDFMKAAQADAPLAQMRAELESRDATIASQSATIDALTARLDALEAAQGVETPEPVTTPGPVVMAAPEPAVEGYTSVLDAGDAEPASEPGPVLASSPDTAEEHPEVKSTPSRRRRRQSAK